MTGPLDGIRVLDLGQVYQGPYCGLLLAYGGCDVVKVEPPGGENVRTRSPDLKPPQVQLLNANKRSITLNLKTDKGKKLFKELVADVDIVLENYRPGTMERLNLGYDTLSEINESIVYAHGSGFGSTGPYSDYPAMDLTIQAMSGIMNSTGYPDRPPVKAGPAVADFLGGIHLFAGIMMALYDRELTGRGQRIEVGMFDCVYPALTSAISAIVEQKDIPERTGNRHSGYSIAPYNSYPTEDGYVVILCVTEEQWQRFEELLEDNGIDISGTDLSSKAKRAKQIDLVDQCVADWTEKSSQKSVISDLRSIDVPCAPVKKVAEVMEDEQLQEREMITNIPNYGEGIDTLPVPGMPIKFSNADTVAIQQAPELGEHTSEILQEWLAIDNDTIEHMIEDNIL